ncbi:VOC family protein [Streptomyces sp. NPDC088747]|uniref:VOC family protein n=1 Tax=Streptomyces sp. NPDC088747 TaxID=3365886 RepID=UPI00382C7737
MSSVIGLGYISAEATDLEQWPAFAENILGAQVVERTPERLRLRLDERAWRIEVRKGTRDRIDTIGWEAAGHADLDVIAQRLADDGRTVHRADDKETRDRQVSGLISFTDSAGMTVEIFYGQTRQDRPFRSHLGHTYVTGTLGLGHVAEWVPDREEHQRLYTDVLGFKLSDYVEENGSTAAFLHCNRRHHSMAVIPQPGELSKISHLMLQVDSIDAVGHTLDACLKGEAELFAHLGKHTNDQMVSFYVTTPSGWMIEYGHGGVEIDDTTWSPVRWNESHLWGGRLAAARR